MAELVDAQDLKSCVKQLTCQFDSGSRQWPPCERGLFFLLLNKIFLFKRGKDCKGWRSQFRSVAKE